MHIAYCRRGVSSMQMAILGGIRMLQSMLFCRQPRGDARYIPMTLRDGGVIRG